MKRIHILWFMAAMVLPLTAVHCEKESADCHHRINFVNQSDKVV